MKRILTLTVFVVACSRQSVGAADTGASASPAATSAPAAASIAAAPSASSVGSAKAQDPIVAKLRRWKKDGYDPKASPPLEVDPLIKEYNDNPVRADKSHKGKPAALVGQISEIGKDPDGAYVDMFGAKGELADHRVRAYIDEADGVSEDRLAASKKKDGCMFACDECKGFDGALFVEFTGCTIDCRPEKK